MFTAASAFFSLSLYVVLTCVETKKTEKNETRWEKANTRKIKSEIENMIQRLVTDRVDDVCLSCGKCGRLWFWCIIACIVISKWSVGLFIRWAGHLPILNWNILTQMPGRRRSLCYVSEGVIKSASLTNYSKKLSLRNEEKRSSAIVSLWPSTINMLAISLSVSIIKSMLLKYSNAHIPRLPLHLLMSVHCTYLFRWKFSPFHPGTI